MKITRVLKVRILPSQSQQQLKITSASLSEGLVFKPGIRFPLILRPAQKGKKKKLLLWVIQSADLTSTPSGTLTIQLYEVVGGQEKPLPDLVVQLPEGSLLPPPALPAAIPPPPPPVLPLSAENMPKPESLAGEPNKTNEVPAAKTSPHHSEPAVVPVAQSKDLPRRFSAQEERRRVFATTLGLSLEAQGGPGVLLPGVSISRFPPESSVFSPYYRPAAFGWFSLGGRFRASLFKGQNYRISFGTIFGLGFGSLVLPTSQTVAGTLGLEPFEYCHFGSRAVCVGLKMGGYLGREVESSSSRDAVGMVFSVPVSVQLPKGLHLLVEPTVVLPRGYSMGLVLPIGLRWEWGFLRNN